jgi:hypothetical protein
MAAEVDRDDPMGGGERVQLPHPVVGIAQNPMKEQQRRPVSVALVGDEQARTRNVSEGA